jgi:hypothetical protein
MEEIEIVESSWEPGRGGSVEVAAERAWENAKKAGAGPGTYELKILVEAENPITTYIVIISPTG